MPYIALLIKSKMASIYTCLNYKIISFRTEWAQKNDFGVYHRVFRYARHGDVAGKNIGLYMMGKIQDGRKLCKPMINKICSRMEADA